MPAAGRRCNIPRAIDAMRALPVLAIVLLLAACGSGGTSAVPAAPSASLPGVTTVVVHGPAFVYLKATSVLRVQLGLADGSVMAAGKADWASSQPSVAAVDQLGAVTGLSSGTTVISATVGVVSGRLPIRVVPDYRGLWRGRMTGPGCGPGPATFTCFLAELSWDVSLRIDQDGGSITGYMFSTLDPAPDDGYLAGHVGDDGALIVDQAGCLKDRCPAQPQVSGWRTVLSPDGRTMTGSYGAWWFIYESYMPRALTLQRVE